MAKGFFWWRCHMCNCVHAKKTPGVPKRSCPNCGCRFEDRSYWIAAPEEDVAEKKITVTMHQVLKAGKDDPDGKIPRGDNGVVTALMRRGLAKFDNGNALITDAGSWAVDHAPLDPRAQPSGMSRPAFDAYLQNRGAD